ncbi:hypothetical protein U1Q18_039871 [Sarracenia purpurea var. burkii]
MNEKNNPKDRSLKAQLCLGDAEESRNSNSTETLIGEFASIADKEVFTRFFKTTMQKLLEVTQEAAKAEAGKPDNSQILR